MEASPNSKRQNLILFYLFLPFYCLGGTMMEHFTVFDSWLHLAEIDFVKVHDQSGMRTFYVFILPLIVHYLLSAIMLWKKAMAPYKKYLWLNIVCHTLIWISTYFIQLPMQLALYTGKDLAMLHTLIQSDWIRIVPIITIATSSVIIIKDNFHSQLKTK